MSTINRAQFDLISVDGDGDGTLWDLEATMRRGLQRAAEMLSGAESRPVQADELARIRDEVAARPAYTSASMEQIRRRSFAEAAAGLGLLSERLVDAVYEAYLTYRFEHLEHYADARPFLASAAEADLPVVLVTNGNTSAAKAGLGDLIRASYVAFEVTLKKPDPALYTFVVEQEGARPDRVLHLGDDPADDIEAAALAGLTTGWINRSGQAWPRSRPRPDLEFAALPVIARG